MYGALAAWKLLEASPKPQKGCVQTPKVPGGNSQLQLKLHIDFEAEFRELHLPVRRCSIFLTVQKEVTKWWNSLFLN